jgi:ribonuclease HI
MCGEGCGMSNNYAELYAMAEGLEYVLQLMKLHRIDSVRVVGDSEVAVRLMSGRYRANREKLYYPQFVRAKAAQYRVRFNDELVRIGALGALVSFEWCPREENQECDDLSKMPVVTASAELLEEAESLLLTKE